MNKNLVQVNVRFGIALWELWVLQQHLIHWIVWAVFYWGDMDIACQKRVSVSIYNSKMDQYGITNTSWSLCLPACSDLQQRNYSSALLVLSEGNPLVTGGFLAQVTSNAKVCQYPDIMWCWETNLYATTVVLFHNFFPYRWAARTTYIRS